MPIFQIDISNIDYPRQLKGYSVKRSKLHDRNFRDSWLIDDMRAKSTISQCTVAYSKHF